VRERIGREALRRLDPLVRASVDPMCQSRKLNELFDDRARNASVVVTAEGDGAVGVATEVTSDFDGSREGLLHTFYVADQAPPHAGQLVIEGIEDAARRRQWRFVRAWVPVHARLSCSLLKRRGWKRSFTIVSKQLTETAEDDRSTSALHTRIATGADIAFLVPLVADSLLQGLLRVERSVIAPEDVHRYANQFVQGLFTTEGTFAIVGEDASGPVGYATANMHHVDELTGTVHALLYDIYTVPRSRGCGYSEALAAVTEDAARRSGRCVIVGTVAEEERRTAAILARLRGRGWAPRSVVFVTAIGPHRVS
jgi:GNAT superfamily N-acetyltransferase